MLFLTVGHRHRFFVKQIPRGKMFLRSLVKLNNSVSFWNFAPKIQVKTKKRFSPHSASISVRNFGFLIAKWILLAEKLRGPDFITKISTNSGYHLKILAIFPEFLNEGQKKKKGLHSKSFMKSGVSPQKLRKHER